MNPLPFRPPPARRAGHAPQVLSALQHALSDLLNADLHAFDGEASVHIAAEHVLHALKNTHSVGNTGTGNTIRPADRKRAAAAQWKLRKDGLYAGMRQLVEQDLEKVVVLYEVLLSHKEFSDLLFVCLDALSLALQKTSTGDGSNSKSRDALSNVAATSRALTLCNTLFAQRYDAYMRQDENLAHVLPSGMSILRVMQVFRVRVAQATGAAMAEAAVDRFYKHVNMQGLKHKAAWEREVSFCVKEATELIMEFDLVREPNCSIDLNAFVRTGVQLHWFSFMQKLVNADGSKNLARVYIETALHMNPPNMWKAHSCMKDMRLENEFPDLVQAYRRGSLVTTMEKKKFSEVLFRLERYHDPNLTIYVVGQLVEQGRHWLARYTADRLGLSTESVAYKSIDQAAVDKHAKEREGEYLHLPTEVESAVVFVDDEATATQAIEWLHGMGPQNIVAMDGEWKASLDSRHNVASILQLSSRSQVFILDLIWLMRQQSDIVAKLCEEIKHMFTRKDLIKVAYGFSSDLDVLTRSYPNHACWRELCSLLDFSHISLVSSDVEEENKWKALHTRKVTRGLKDLVLQVLGKRLCKLEQLSNWEARPLRSNQIHYAALDAYALAQVTDEVFPHHSYPAELLMDCDRISEPNHHRHKRIGDNSKAPQQQRVAMEHKSQVALNATRQQNEDYFELAKNELKRRCQGLACQFVNETEMNAYTSSTGGATASTEGEVRLVKLSHDMVAVKKVASDLGVAPSQVLKSMAYMVNEGGSGWKPVLVLVRGDSTVKEDQLCTWANGMVRRATADECLIKFNMPGGALGPIAGVSQRQGKGSKVKGKFRVICDSAILELTGPVFTGIGSFVHCVRFDSVDTMSRMCADVILSGISNATKPASKPQLSSQVETKFIVDNMLGKVGKMLRIVGMDCTKTTDVPGVEEIHAAAAAGEPHPQSVPVGERLVLKRQRNALRTQELNLVLASARSENRVFLTTDRKVVERFRKDNIVMLSNHSDRFKQFEEICRLYAIKLDMGGFLSRCIKCNGLGFETIEPDEIIRLKSEGHKSVEAVPSEILQTVTHFYRCKQPACYRVYWEGPKFQHCCEKYQCLYEDANGDDSRQLKNINSFLASGEVQRNPKNVAEETEQMPPSADDAASSSE